MPQQPDGLTKRRPQEGTLEVNRALTVARSLLHRLHAAAWLESTRSLMHDDGRRPGPPLRVPQ